MRILQTTLAVALIGAGSAGYALGRTQTRIVPVAPSVVSGDDVGFRVIGRQGGTPVGHWVVRIDGKWVRAAHPVEVVPTSK
jgi:hypothetical protein